MNFTPPTPEIEAGWNVTYDLEAYGNGPIQLTFPDYMYPGQRKSIAKVIFKRSNAVAGYQWQAWLEMGIKPSNKPASGNAVGIFWVPTAQDPVTRTRSFARPGYHDVSKTRPNYHLLINHKVLNISITESLGRLQATGISFQAVNGTGAITHVRANREVILSAGFHSSQILQRSGIGPAAILTKAKIPVKLDLPGVGQNFQDHPSASMSVSCRHSKSLTAIPALILTQMQIMSFHTQKCYQAIPYSALKHKPCMKRIELVLSRLPVLIASPFYR